MSWIWLEVYLYLHRCYCSPLFKYTRESCHYYVWFIWSFDIGQICFVCPEGQLNSCGGLDYEPRSCVAQCDRRRRWRLVSLVLEWLESPQVTWVQYPRVCVMVSEEAVSLLLKNNQLYRFLQPNLVLRQSSSTWPSLCAPMSSASCQLSDFVHSFDYPFIRHKKDTQAVLYIVEVILVRIHGRPIFLITNENFNLSIEVILYISLLLIHY